MTVANDRIVFKGTCGQLSAVIIRWGGGSVSWQLIVRRDGEIVVNAMYNPWAFQEARAQAITMLWDEYGGWYGW